MNYLAHALAGLDRPYFVAGTSVPDWLSVVDRSVRARSAGARRLLEDDEEDVRQLAEGVIRHHEDDRWFHGTRAFAETNLQLAVELRDQLPGDDGFRPSFVGHILVEMLLDATLIEDDPALVDRYYRSLAALRPDRVEATVNRIAARPTGALVPLVPRFIAERFLYDYARDDKLWFRLNQVMRRVRLPPLPAELVPWIATARRRVRQVREALLTPPSPATSTSLTP
jgi:hypothetical protein